MISCTSASLYLIFFFFFLIFGQEWYLQGRHLVVYSLKRFTDSLWKPTGCCQNYFKGICLPRSICSSWGGWKMILLQAAPISSLDFSLATLDCVTSNSPLWRDVQEVLVCAQQQEAVPSETAVDERSLWVGFQHPSFPSVPSPRQPASLWGPCSELSPLGGSMA